MLVGYARASTRDGSLKVQCGALEKAGCKRIFTDVDGDASARGLSEALDYLRPGDTLVVWKLDRLARSLRDVMENVIALHELNVGFRSLDEALDTTRSGRHVVVQVLAALVDFERNRVESDQARKPATKRPKIAQPSRRTR